jgi:hypothetical protein
VFDSSGTQIPDACNDDFEACPGEGNCDLLSQLTIPMTGTVRYYIRVSGYRAVGPFTLYVRGGGGSCSYPNDDLWFPQAVEIYSDMGNVPNEYFPDIGPWVKLHLGWIKPLVVTHDGTYTLSDAETVRSFSQQTSQPEALIVYDPLRPDAYKEYFLLENRNIETLPDVVPATIMDRGMAVWLINEYQTVGRRIEWLIRRGGHRAADSAALWDGINDADGYDLTTISNPRNTNWTNDSPSYIEIYDISAADPVMTFKVRMPPIFVDQGNGDYENGWLDNPFNTINEGLAAIPEHPRTLKIAGGSYPETMTINAPCTLMGWRNGNAVIGQ